jgi:pimeloyl-ACP methyl ester carboxylesterase
MRFFLGHRRTDRPLWRRLPRMARFVLRLAFAQESLLFQPGRPRPASPAGLGLAGREVTLPGGRGEVLSGWWIPGPPGGRAFLFLPGAIGSLGRELPALAFLASLGAGVLALDYPGYGSSSGRPSIAGCRRAAEAGFDHLSGALGHEPGRILLWGRSLGAFFAATLAARQEVAGLVFHDGMASVPEFAALYLPRPLVRLFCTVRLSCAEALAARRAPGLFLHARDDEVVPFDLGRRAYLAAAGPKRFLELAGGHFDSGWQEDPRLHEHLADLLAGRAAGWQGTATGTAA